MALLDVNDLRVRFETHHGTVRAVDGVSFSLDEGETLGLVGESGSGKSVTNLGIMGLVPSPPGVVEAGHVLLEGRDLVQMSDAQLRGVRGNEVSMIFQDPMTSLNPLHRVEKQITETLTLHKGLGATAASSETDLQRSTGCGLYSYRGLPATEASGHLKRTVLRQCRGSGVGFFLVLHLQHRQIQALGRVTGNPDTDRAPALFVRPHSDAESHISVGGKDQAFY